MTLPKRVKVDWRVKGGKRPDGVIDCGRTSKWGNPFKVGEPVVAYEGARPVPVPDAATACRFFRVYAREKLKRDPHWLDPLYAAEGLACPGCDPEDEHCHVVELLAIMVLGVRNAHPQDGCAAGSDSPSCGHGTQQTEQGTGAGGPREGHLG